MKCSLGILIFLKRSLVFPILFFSSISLHWSLKKALLSLFAILWNSAFRCLYLSFSPLLFASLLFTAICKASPDSHFAFLNEWHMYPCKKDPRELPHPACPVRTQWKDSCLWTRKWELTKHWTEGALVFDFSAFRTLRNTFLLLATQFMAFML